MADGPISPPKIRQHHPTDGDGPRREWGNGVKRLRRDPKFFLFEKSLGGRCLTPVGAKPLLSIKRVRIAVTGFYNELIRVPMFF